MIKKYLLGIVLIAYPALCSAQSLLIETVNNSSGNGASTYSLESGKVSLEENRIRFQTSKQTIDGFSAYGVSADQSMVAVLSGKNSESRVILANSLGDTVSSFKVTNLSAGDPSIAVYPANTGAVLVRDNIANFNFYDSFGGIVKNLSGSSQSEGGEAISEVAFNPSAETVVIYTPKIKRESNLGSQIQYVDEGMNLKSLFFSTDRFIKDVKVTQNGQFISFVTAKEGSDDLIHITDRFGNEIASLSSEENLSGVNLSEDGSHITAYSDNRVLVFNTLSGERTGSTSFRSEVVKAVYFPDDNTIVALTGSYNDSSGIVNNVSFHAINVAKRKVERKDYGSSLHLNKVLQPGFNRIGTNQYQFGGANKTLELRVTF